MTTGPTGNTGPTGPTGNTGPTGPGVTLVAGFSANTVLLANGTQTTINGPTAGTLSFNGTTLATSGGISAGTSTIGSVTLNAGALTGVTTVAATGLIASSVGFTGGSGSLTTLTASGVSTIGGVTHTSGALTGVTTVAATGLIASTVGFTGPATNTINNLNIGLTGGAITNTATTSNQIGGVTLNNGAVSGITTLGCGAITSSGALGLSTNGITSGTILPSANNTYNLGSSSAVWANVYATNLSGALTGNCSGSSASCTGNAATATLLNVGKGFSTGNWYTTNETAGCNRFYFVANGQTYVGGTDVRIRAGATSGNNIALFATNGVYIGTVENQPSYMLDVAGTINLPSPQGLAGNISIRYSNVQTLTGYSNSATINPPNIPNVIDVGTTAASAYSATPTNTTSANTTTNPNSNITMGHCFNRIRAVGGFLSYTVTQLYTGQNYNVHWYLPWTTYQISISSVGMTGTNTIVNYAIHLSAIAGTTGTGFSPGVGVLAAFGSAPNWGYYSYGVWQVPNGSTGSQIFTTSIAIISPAMANYVTLYGVY